MSKITSKYQVSIPRVLAERLGVKPGDEIDWRLAGRELRVTPVSAGLAATPDERLQSFDEATQRQAARNRRRPAKRPAASRGWTREELYTRDRSG